MIKLPVLLGLNAQLSIKTSSNRRGFLFHLTPIPLHFTIAERRGEIVKSFLWNDVSEAGEALLERSNVSEIFSKRFTRFTQA